MWRSAHFLIAGWLLFACFTEASAQDYSSNILSGYKERKDKAIAVLAGFTKPDTARVNALIDVIATAVIAKQRQELSTYCDEALAISRKLNYVPGIVTCYNWKGSLSKGLRDIPVAHLYFDSVITLVGITSNLHLQKYKADAHRGKAWIFYEQENYHAALNHFFQALSYYQDRDRTASMHMFTIIANTYSRVNNFEQATVYAQKNAALADLDTNSMMKAQAYISMAEIYVRTRQLSQAMTYLNKVKPYIPDPVQVMVNSGYYLNRGQVHYLQEQYDSAFYFYKLAYNIASGSNHNINTTASLYYLANSALKLGKLDSAKMYAEQNLILAEKNKAKIGKINALLNLADYNHATNNNSRAYDLLQQATALKDSLLLEANLNQINTLAAIYESDKKEKEILELEKIKQKQSAEVKQQYIFTTVFIASTIALLILGYLGFINFKKNRQIATQEQLLQNQKIAELEKDKQLATIEAMLKGQEEERSRIAKDLHDGLGGLLSGTKMSLINLKEPLDLTHENAGLFNKSLSMLDNAMGDLRKIAHNLMPEALVKFGLLEALRDFCDAIESSSGIKVLYQPLSTEGVLNNTSQIFVYRIIQELVNNAVKYAEAKRIIVQLTLDKNKTGITVEDDGRGFDINELSTSKGAGLANVRYRVQFLNGTIDILTSPGNGTSVNIGF
jgi:two-component system NarL family sensor kinase